MSANLLAGYSQPTSLPCDDILFPVASVSGALPFERSPSFEEWGVIIHGSSSKTLRLQHCGWLQPEAIVQLGIRDTWGHLKPQIHSDLLNVSQSAGVMLLNGSNAQFEHIWWIAPQDRIFWMLVIQQTKSTTTSVYLLAISNLLKHPNSWCYWHALARTSRRELVSFNVNVVRVLDVLWTFIWEFVPVWTEKAEGAGVFSVLIPSFSWAKGQVGFP